MRVHDTDGSWRVAPATDDDQRYEASSRTMRNAIDLEGFRSRVDRIAERIGGAHQDLDDGHIVVDLLADPVIADVLSHHPEGRDEAVATLRREVMEFVPNARSSASDLVGLVRVYLLHQIDVLWWGDQPPYETSRDVTDAADLVDLDGLRQRGMLRFRYRRQPPTFAHRVLRAARRRIPPQLSPPSAGLRYTRARPEAVALLNQIADQFVERCGGAGTRAARAGVWVNSAVRSAAHQDHLRGLGYSALRPSSHCSGYAMDVAVEWLQPTGGDVVLKAILLERQDAGEINVIDEGQAWHICLGPNSMADLRAAYHEQMRE
ncbi:DUF5715 family protein [Prescottella agglutinans]|uniref:Uncharacterized protein n=1 Tax=Prescottella agglutinans TaxID=1644129 RepID=A0ABT6M7L7_9NOCA|nr:DUF5715 family protein [Prescottella agglutinans]MDH6280303.1 hypothetical protein [Prescottella agglutinans]